MLAELKNEERIEADRAVLRDVLAELATDAQPVWDEWVALAKHDRDLHMASGLMFKLYELESEPFTRRTVDDADGYLGSICLHLRAFLHPDESRGPERFGSRPPDWEELVVTAVVTAAVVPFLKTLMTKAAEDTYAAARALLRRLFGQGRPAKRGDASQSKLLIVHDTGPELDLALHLGVDTSDKALRALADLDLDAVAGDAKRRKVKKLTIRWDQATQSWKAHEH